MHIFRIWSGRPAFNPRSIHTKYSKNGMWCPRGAMIKAMDCGIVESEFVLQSSYYIYLRANTLTKGMKPLILPAMG